MARSVNKKRISKTFKDISLSFVPHPVTNDLGTFNDADAIKRSVTNLVRTNIGERFFQNLIGSKIEKALFEQPSEDLSAGLQEEIQYLLENFEERIANIMTRVYHPPDSNDMHVHLTYNIIGLPLPVQDIDFILQSTRT
jgi:phage baseplate assembly protein W